MQDIARLELGYDNEMGGLNIYGQALCFLDGTGTVSCRNNDGLTGTWTDVDEVVLP